MTCDATGVQDIGTTGTQARRCSRVTAAAAAAAAAAAGVAAKAHVDAASRATTQFDRTAQQTTETLHDEE